MLNPTAGESATDVGEQNSVAARIDPKCHNAGIHERFLILGKRLTAKSVE
jgi:hypothetical protein